MKSRYKLLQWEESKELWTKKLQLFTGQLDSQFMRVVNSNQEIVCMKRTVSFESPGWFLLPSYSNADEKNITQVKHKFYFIRKMRSLATGVSWNLDDMEQ